jgi:hypothetical protein
MFYNNLLAVLVMLVLLAVVLVPKFSKFLVILNHRVLAAGTLTFALEALAPRAVRDKNVGPKSLGVGQLPRSVPNQGCDGCAPEKEACGSTQLNPCLRLPALRKTPESSIERRISSGR